MFRAFGICIASMLFVLAASASVAKAVDPAVLAAQQRRVEVVQNVAPTVVAIFARGGAGGGSGVLISPDGYALSNFHVTNSAGTFMKCGLSDGVLYDAVIVGIDPTGDVALLKLLGRDDFPFAKLGDSDKLQVGDWAFAMGNPFLLATDFQTTVTYGIISGVHRYQYPAGTFLEYADCIQTDTSINPGNSGGPLFNGAGELVGINGRGSFEKRGRVNSGAGYAISINQIKHFMDHLRSGRIVDHATLGATVQTLDDGAVIVSEILEASEAYRRGLRSGDEIVSFAGRSIRSVNQFKNIIGIFPKGWKLPLVYRHEERKVETYVRLRGLHRKSELTPKKRRRPHPVPLPKKPGDKPKDGDKKGSDKKGGDKKDVKKKPMPIPTGNQPPAKYKHMYVKKDGFINYYFNKLEQDRTLQGLKSLGNFKALGGGWNITGKTKTGEKVEVTLTEKGLGLEIGEAVSFQALDGSDLEDEPKGSGGLLVALYHLKLMLTKGDQGFTEFYYLGSEPFDRTNEKADVIVTVLTGVESRWYFNRADGRLLGLDTQLDPADDVCELRFQGLHTSGNHKLPEQILVRHAEQEFVTLNIENAILREGEKQPAATTKDAPAKDAPEKDAAAKTKK